MKKVAQWILFLVFSVVITVPFLFADKQGGQISRIENRVLSKFPEIFVNGEFLPERFIVEFEDWLNDNAKGREASLLVDSYLNYHLFDVLVSDLAITGKDGFTFLLLPEFLQKRYVGELMPDENELQNQLNEMYLMQQYVENNGARFLFTLIPSKTTVYSDKVPDTVVPDDITYYSAFNTALVSDARINYLELSDIMKENRENATLYPARIDSTHWNNYGAYLGYEEIAKRLGIDHIPLEECDIKQIEINDYISFSSVPTTDIDYEISYDTSNWQMDNGYLSDNNLSDLIPQNEMFASNNENELLPSILFLGDSYRSRINSLLANVCSSYVSTHYTYTSAIQRLIDIEQPDIVIYQVVERTLPTLSYIPYIENGEMDYISPSLVYSDLIKGLSKTENTYLCSVDNMNYNDDTVSISGTSFDQANNMSSLRTYIRNDDLCYLAPQSAQHVYKFGNAEYFGFTSKIPMSKAFCEFSIINVNPQNLTYEETFFN